jgi:hypothetical protein
MNNGPTTTLSELKMSAELSNKIQGNSLFLAGFLVPRPGVAQCN